MDANLLEVALYERGLNVEEVATVMEFYNYGGYTLPSYLKAHYLAAIKEVRADEDSQKR